jgi:hypothetical protein
MAVVCDTAVLIAADRQDRRVAALARAAASAGEDLVIPAGCVAQAWRDPRRQVALGLFLRGCREIPLDPAAARAAGLLLAQTGLTDVIDASVATAAQRGDSILTGDPGDVAPLSAAAGDIATVLRF